MTQNLPNPGARRVRRPTYEVEEDEYVHPLSAPPERPRGSGGGVMQIILVSLVVAAVVAYAMISFVGVTKNDFTSNLSALATDLGAVKQTQTTIQDSLSNRVTTAQLATQLSGYALKSDIPKPTDFSGYYSKTEVDGLLKAATDRIKALEDWKAEQGTTTTTTTGQAAVSFVNGQNVSGGILLVYSPGTVSFAVQITNSTGSYEYVSYGFDLICTTPTTGVTITATSLSNLSFPAITYANGYGYIPAAPHTTQITIYPTSSPRTIPVAPNSTIQCLYTLTLTGDGAQWQGNITSVYTSSTWQ